MSRHARLIHSRSHCDWGDADDDGKGRRNTLIAKQTGSAAVEICRAAFDPKISLGRLITQPLLPSSIPGQYDFDLTIYVLKMPPKETMYP